VSGGIDRRGGTYEQTEDDDDDEVAGPGAPREMTCVRVGARELRKTIGVEDLVDVL